MKLSLFLSGVPDIGAAPNGTCFTIKDVELRTGKGFKGDEPGFNVQKLREQAERLIEIAARIDDLAARARAEETAALLFKAAAEVEAYSKAQPG